MAIFAAAVLVVALSAIVVQSGTDAASAAEVSFSQCNNRGAGIDGAPLSVTCSVSIVNTIDASGGSSSVVYVRTCTLNACTGDTVSSSDVVNAVSQCNGSDNVGGSTTVCSVDIVNNISLDAPAAATALTLNQCNGSGGGGGTDMTACIPSSQGAPAVTQCNGSGTGGGGGMTCTASGTVSAAFPVTVDQCNGSENGGGSFVTCTTTITTNVVDTTPVATTPVTTVAPGGTGGGTTTPSTPAPTAAPGGGTPGTDTPAGDSPGTPPGTPTVSAAPPVLAPPALAG